jgi:hypothetical protein
MYFALLRRPLGPPLVMLARAADRHCFQARRHLTDEIRQVAYWPMSAKCELHLIKTGPTAHAMRLEGA